MQLVTLTNDFHNSSVVLRCEVLQHIHNELTIYPTVHQIKRSKRKLCGIPGCTCSNDCGIRGKQQHNGKPLVVDISAIFRQP
jgi:hypothetical protein